MGLKVFQLLQLVPPLLCNPILDTKSLRGTRVTDLILNQVTLAWYGMPEFFLKQVGNTHDATHLKFLKCERIFVMPSVVKWLDSISNQSHVCHIVLNVKLKLDITVTSPH